MHYSLYHIASIMQFACQVTQRVWEPTDFFASTFFIADGFIFLYWHLTHKQLETYGYVSSTVATDAQVLKHQVISTPSSD